MQGPKQHKHCNFHQNLGNFFILMTSTTALEELHSEVQRWLLKSIAQEYKLPNICFYSTQKAQSILNICM